MTPKKPDWFELAEGDQPSSGVRKIDKKLPIAALAAVGVVIVAGSIFANANDEPSAVAETPSVSQNVNNSDNGATSNDKSVNNGVSGQSDQGKSITPNKNSAPAPVVNSGKSSGGSNSLPVPTVTVAPQRGGEHEGRERPEGGEHREGGGEHEGRERDDD